MFEDTVVYIVVKCAQRYCITSMLPSCRIDNNTIHRPSSAMKYNLNNYYNGNIKSDHLKFLMPTVTKTGLCESHYESQQKVQSSSKMPSLGKKKSKLCKLYEQSNRRVSFNH